MCKCSGRRFLFVSWDAFLELGLIRCYVCLWTASVV
jgi:hypothetical protein